jgi:hypothetical protein
MRLIYVIVIILFIIFAYNFLLFYSNKENYSEVNNVNEIKNIFAYWENIDTTPTPTHIQLCFDTFYKHLLPENGYRLHILNEKTIHNYLPDVRKDLDGLLIAQKTDYYRVALLYKYGGIWIDSDTVIFKSLDDIFKKLKTYDYVGFGYTGDIYDKKYLYGFPSNWVIASQKNSVLMKLCLDKLDKKLDNKKNNYDYFDLGKYIIWDAIKELQYDKSYKYYHFTPEYDGTRDINGFWIHSPNHFSNKSTIFLDESKMMIAFLSNSEINSHDEYKWIKTASKEEILNKDILISKLFRKALQ